MADKNTDEKLASLRAQFQEHDINGYMVPRADEWQGEYVPAKAERLAWLTGFKGSVGQALVTADKAAVYSNKIYTVQMGKQLDSALFDAETEDKDAGHTADKWFADNLNAGDKVGYDPRLYTIKKIKERQEELAKSNITLVPVNENLVDAVWGDQSEHPMDEVLVHPETLAGESSASKIIKVASDVNKEGAKAVLLTAPDSIAWLLNVRGRDIPHTPVPLSYALVHEDGFIDWFIPPAKVTDEVKAHIGADIHIHDFNDMPDVLAAAAKDNKILLDESTVSIRFKEILERDGGEIAHFDDPVVPRKAIKNETERLHIEQGHIQDGIALVKFWKWIDENALNGGITELEASRKLYGFRAERPGFIETSFDAIVGWAENGADIHYNVTEESSREITENNILLVDSGGQYPGCTTDNTRWRIVGAPIAEMVENSTRVLKGHIAVANSRFGDKVASPELDKLARKFLKEVGLEIPHGIGHGVSSGMSVHEKGAGIREEFKKPYKPGMLTSNEPGYYKVVKDGEAGVGYGIRAENLVFVEETGDPELKYKFNTVSLTPFDRKLIDVDLLVEGENGEAYLQWLNEYHQKIYDNLAPHLDQDEKEWLQKETAPLKRGLAP